MSLKLNEKYAGRFNNPSSEYPQGSFKNRTSPSAEDGSYFEQDWANDHLAFLSSLLVGAGITANGEVDKVGASQYYDALLAIIGDLVPESETNGQCRLGFVSSSSIRLSAYGGNRLMINGSVQQIPAGGVSLSSSGLSASSLYYIYAYVNSGSIALEASATGHSTNSTGVEIKSGDPSRSLVGMVYMNASSQFSDSQTARHVASWFNRRSVGGVLSRTTTINFTNVGTMAEVSTGDRVSFLSWSDESTEIKALGQYVGGAAGQSVSVQCYVDGAAYANNSASYVPVANSGIVFCSGSSFSISGSPLSEGRHIAQVYSGLGNGASGGAITALANSVMTRI